VTRSVLERMSPIQLMKAVKNATELEGMRQAHLRDAAALVTFLSWLETAVTRGVDARFPPVVAEEAGAAAVADGGLGSAGAGAGAGASVDVDLDELASAASPPAASPPSPAPARAPAPAPAFAAAAPPRLAFPLTEFTAGRVLDEMRAQVRGFVSLSFETIAGFGANGAVIHYRAEEATAARVDAGAPFLLDSGGQYEDGTTDVTRTVHFGAPTPRQRAAYTAVLQGHIALSSARFPSGTAGQALDALTRAPLWAAGLDYAHGTGHGVGAFLNVHEGPQFIANAQRSSYEGGLVEHMTITDEPGYYEEGAFGIRIENVLVVRRVADAPAGSLIAAPGAGPASREPPAAPVLVGGAPLLEFEPLTLVPISTRMLERARLSPRERAWLNDYNARCRQALAPLLHGHALEYLLRETYPVLGGLDVDHVAALGLPAAPPPRSPPKGAAAADAAFSSSSSSSSSSVATEIASPRSAVRIVPRPVLAPRSPESVAAAAVGSGSAPSPGITMRDTHAAPALTSPRSGGGGRPARLSRGEAAPATVHGGEAAPKLL
jgi:Xaa-Pro aminopeptidase